MIRRFKSTCRSFSRRIWVMPIMHATYGQRQRLLGCGNGYRPRKEENGMTQKRQSEAHGELYDKRIVVLGGSSGIGLEVAQQAVAKGARAIIASSNVDRVEQAVAMLDGKAEGYPLD